MTSNMLRLFVAFAPIPLIAIGVWRAWASLTAMEKRYAFSIAEANGLLDGPPGDLTTLKRDVFELILDVGLGAQEALRFLRVIDDAESSHG